MRGERLDRGVGNRLLLVDDRGVDQPFVLHLMHRRNQSADGARFRRIGVRERCRKWKEQIIVQRTGEDAANEGWHRPKLLPASLLH